MVTPVRDEPLSKLDKILSVLRGVDRGSQMACCPHHNDTNPSMHWSVRKSGWFVCNCFTGCTQAQIKSKFAELGVTSFFVGGDETRYEICDPAGTVQAVHVRRDFDVGRPKEMHWQLPNGAKTLGGRAIKTLPLYGIHEVQPGQPVVLVEGEKTRDALQEWDICAVGTVCGAKSMPTDEVLRPLLGHRVILWADNDEPGREHMLRIAARLRQLDHTELRWVNPWEGAEEGDDAADYVGDPGHLIGDAGEVPVVAASGKEPERAEDKEDGRLTFTLTTLHPRDIRDPIITRLLEANAPVPKYYRRGDALAIIDVLDDEAQVKVITPDDLGNILTDIANFYLPTKNGLIPTWPPHPLKGLILKSPRIKEFPVVDRIVSVPVFSPKGELITKPGYHADAKLFYRPDPNILCRPVSDNPTDLEIHLALRAIWEVLADFKFDDEKASLAHAVGLMLLPFARDLINGPTPLHMASGPGPGVGKTKLINCMLLPALGRDVPRTTEAEDEAEWRKKIFSLLLEGQPAILIDNLHRELRSAAFSSWVEGRVAQDRPLGHSKIISVRPRAIWCATGNNPSIHADANRRTVHMRVDPKVERPEQRGGWRYDPLESFILGGYGWGIGTRGVLVWSCCTLIQAWLRNGRPKGEATLASFEAWSHVIGGILKNATVEGFLGNREQFAAESVDFRLAGMYELVEMWWKRFGTEELSVTKLQPMGEHLELGFKGTTERARQTELGQLLKENKGRVINECRIVARQDKRSGAWRYRLESGRKRPVTD
jgi:hypothetical protein